MRRTVFKEQSSVKLSNIGKQKSIPFTNEDISDESGDDSVDYAEEKKEKVAEIFQLPLQRMPSVI